MKYLIIIVFLVNSVFGFSQENNVVTYKYEVEDCHKSDLPFPVNTETYCCEIRLYENQQKYDVIFTSSLSEDIVEEIALSYGFYNETGNQITLNDQILNYNMILERNNEKIFFTKSFIWLLNKEFTLSSKETYPLNDHWYEYVLVNNLISGLKGKEKPFKNITILNTIFQGGNYTIIFLEDYSYKLYINEILISIGKWDYKDITIEITDSSLKQSFYLYTAKDKLVSALLPGDSRGIVLEAIRDNHD